jgi:DNA-binding PadR family transcriptional regulator
MRAERARLPLLLLSLLAERPMHGYELNQQIEERAVRQWAAVGFSSIYQTLERLAAQGLLQTEERPSGGQGAPYRTVYSLTRAGREWLEQLARAALASAEHQRFEYDLGVGVALTHLPLPEVKRALERRSEVIRIQAERAAAACRWAERMLGAWAVLDHQRRALQAELAWLDGVIERLETE